MIRDTREVFSPALAEPHPDPRFQALLEMSQSLHQSINLDELLQVVISKIKELMNAETVSVILHDAHKNEFFFQCATGNPREGAAVLKELRFPVHKGFAGQVFRSGKPLLVDDVQGAPGHFKNVDQATGFQTRSMIAVPLKTPSKTVGVLEVCNRKEGRFTSGDVNFLSSIATSVAMAVHNAYTHSVLDEAYQELQEIDRTKDELLDRTQQENLWLRREVEGRYHFARVIGKSPQMIEVFRLCEKVIDSDISVLIEGETGTGKELIARCIHCNGPRRHRPFVTQNCGSLPESLLASELFGHRKGAFTGAVCDKKGLFAVAEGGTVFLDEVAEMSPAMQVSLLRVLQEGEVRPLGSETTGMVDVRVISATNRSLEEDVRRGRFRQDLYYRLSVFPLKIPPLRDRIEDIPLLVAHFMGKISDRTRKNVGKMSEGALRALCRYPFPGNIREMENEIERAVAMADPGKPIELRHLSDRFRRPLTMAGDEVQVSGSLREMVAELEKTTIARMIEQFHGNKAKIARELGLSRYGLAKKMKRYGL